MRVLCLVAGTMILSGCSYFFPSRANTTCESASHALRVHDSRIEAARAQGAMGFTANLATRGYQTYHCVTTQGNQVACSTIEAGLAAHQSTQITRLLRERNLIENRVARACQI